LEDVPILDMCTTIARFDNLPPDQGEVISFFAAPSKAALKNNTPTYQKLEIQKTRGVCRRSSSSVLQNTKWQVMMEENKQGEKKEK